MGWQILVNPFGSIVGKRDYFLQAKMQIWHPKAVCLNLLGSMNFAILCWMNKEELGISLTCSRATPARMWQTVLKTSSSWEGFSPSFPYSPITVRTEHELQGWKVLAVRSSSEWLDCAVPCIINMQIFSGEKYVTGHALRAETCWEWEM